MVDAAGAEGLPAGPGDTWVVDLDGVVWLAGTPIGEPGAVLGGLRDRGVRVLFATNNSAPTTAELVDRLARVGVAASAGDLVTSAQAVAGLIEPGSAVLVVAGDGVREALAGRGVRTVEPAAVSGPAPPPVDTVVVGWTHEFDFDLLAAATRALRAGARLVGTNEDPTHPTPGGLLPGSGALLAAVATAGGVVPVVAGKPHGPMAELLTRRLGDGPGRVVLVGDQPATDGALAARIGARFALVDSGVTPPGVAVDGVDVAVRAADLAALCRALTT